MDLFSYLLGKSQGGSGSSGVEMTSYFGAIWDGKTEGKDYIDLTNAIGFNLYKLDRAVYDREELLRMRPLSRIGELYFLAPALSAGVAEITIVDSEGWVGIFNNNTELPVLVSGREGTYDYNGIPVHIPADGTYIDIKPTGAQIYGIFNPTTY